MQYSNSEQAYLFLVYIITGIIIGILFDIFRIFRRSFRTPDIVTYVQDVIFWILVGLLLLYTIFVFNNGEIRGYIFLGTFLGNIVYFLTISKFFVIIGNKFINCIKFTLKFSLKIIIFPLKILRKIFLKPITIISINVTKTLKNLFIVKKH